MKRLARFLILACLCLAVASTSWAQHVVNIAVFAGPFPSLFINEDGQAEGIYIDLLTRILPEAGYEPRFVLHDSFQAAVQNVVNGTMDLVPGVARRPEREAVLDFNSVALSTGWGQVFVPVGSTIESILDLRDRLVGVMEGDQIKDRFDETMAAFDIPYQQLAFPDITALVASIADGSVDACVLVNSVNYQEFPIRATGIVFAPTSGFAATTKGRHPELLAELDLILSRIKTDRNSYYYEIIEKWTTSISGTVLPRWVRWSAAVITALALLLLIFNILLRRQVQRGVASLAQSEIRFRSYIENARDIVFSFDLDGRLSYVSPNSREFMAEPSLPVLVAWFEGRVHPDDLPAVRHYFSVPAEVSRNHESVEYRIKRLDGSWCWHMSNLSALPGPKGAIQGYLGIARDITELKLSGQKLLEREAQLQRILENLQDSYFQADLAGNLSLVNKTAGTMYGYDSPDEMVGLPDSSLYAKPEDRDALLKNLRLNGHVKDWTCRGIKKDGTAFWVSMNVQFIRNQQGAIIANEGVVRDISERMHSEAKIKEALEEKTLLIRELYHRTRNNMQVIMSMMQLQASFNADTRTASVMEDCVRRVQAMALVHDKLYEARHLTRLSLDEYLAELCQLIIKSIPVPGIDLELDLARVLVSIDTAVPCGLVVNELLSNALRHAFPGRDSGSILVSLTAKAGSCFVLEVADNGVGLPAGMDYHRNGTLGLQTIVGIVEHQLQGSLTVDGSAGLRCTIEFADTEHADRVAGCS